MAKSFKLHQVFCHFSLNLKILKRTFYLFCATLNFLAGIWIFPGEVARGAESWMGSNFESQDTFSDIWNLWLMGAGFVVTTITTVGFGDLLPQNSSEQGIVMMFQVNIENI